MKDRLLPLGQERIDPIGHGKKGKPTPSYSADQVESLIPALRLSNQRGFDVYLTPLDPAHHHLVVNGLTPARWETLRTQGYMPALVQQFSEKTLQAVIKVPREVGRKDEQGLAGGIELDLNQKFGGNAVSDVGHQSLPMAGFTHHQGAAKKSVLTVILDSLGQLCQKTWNRLVALRKDADQAMQEAESAQRVAKEKALRAAEVVRLEMEASTYRQYAAKADEAQSQDQVDAMVASGMLKENYSSDKVMAALRTSPDLVHRHADVDSYVNALVEGAQESQGIEVANVNVNGLRRKAKLNG